ncbi:MAG: coiled-coil domain-containing protein [Dysosmobacter welbionis]
MGRLDAINEIMKYDQGVIDDLKALQAEIEEKKATLESSKAETEAAKAELVSKENELNTQRSQANAVIQQLSANENETEAHWQIWRRSRTPCGRRPSASATSWWPSRPPTASPQSPIQAATSGR